MTWLRACPRCHGDLHLESDHFGEFVSCLQRGAILNESQEGALRVLAMARRLLRSSQSRSAIPGVSGLRAALWARG